MKRITVWVDSKNDDTKKVCKRLKKLLSSMELRNTIVEVSELAESGESK
jgi:hypothetical protein